MRLHAILTAKGPKRRAQNPNTIPIRQMLPLRLKDKVVESGRNSMEGKCLFEMSLLFKCWEDNDFNDTMCGQYMKNLQQCYQNYMTTTAVRKEQQKIDIPTPNAKNLSTRQISYLLRKYPTV
ncbi:uncharacterized protein LOC108629991 [Ceratina calcarata]|nr:uncharacterized protein LOC108629991 [Ceratina calcarata]XP_017888521.1 uncharacterized protein LOC108629991 [Ceratina calcarata]